MAPDWSVHLLQLAARGEMGRVPLPGKRALFLDLPALAQPWSCVTGLCSPGMRAPRARSCCADLEVELSPEEVGALDAALPEIAAFLQPRDPRWRDGSPQWHEGEVLLRPGRRCVFALPPGADGLSCGLHALEDATGRARGTLKPLPCRLFPLVVVDAEEGRTLLTAVSRRTWRLAGSRPVRAFPCIQLADAPTIAEACGDTIAALFGARAAHTAAEAARTWARADEVERARTGHEGPPPPSSTG